MDFYNREVFGKTRAAAAAVSTQGPVLTPRTWEDEMLDALDNDDPTVPGPAAEVPASSPVSRPAEIRQTWTPSPPRSPEPDPQVIASLDINSRVSMQSVRPSSPLTTTGSVGLSAVAQLEVGVTRMSVSSAGARVAQAALPGPAPQSRRVSSRRAAPAAPAHPSQAAVQSGSSNEVAAGAAVQPRRTTREGKRRTKG